MAAGLDVHAHAYSLARLELGLKHSSADFDQNQRLGVQVAINITMEFLCSVPRLSGPDLLKPFRKLLDCFQDADDGVATPLFKPAKQAHRPLDPAHKRSFRAYTAATMELLISCLHYPKPEAGDIVAKELRRLKIPIGNSRTGRPAATIASWRDRAAAGDKKQELDAFVYSDFLMTSKPAVTKAFAERGDREAIKNELLAKLGDVCRQLGM